MNKNYPSKLYYSISEVAGIAGVKAHVLRYWESEFPTLRPKKTRSGSRRYRQSDIEEILAIKTLLYDEGFKIAGARKVRREARSQSASRQEQEPAQMQLGFESMDDHERLEHIRSELRAIQDLLLELKKLKGDERPSDGPPKQMKAKG